MNKVILVGNLTRDVELRYMPNGSAVAAFGLAVNRAWKDKNSGERRDEVMFIDINIFGRSAEIANQYLSKGKKVLIEGRLRLEQWQDQNGGNRSKHSVVCESFEFLDPKDGNSGANMGGDFGGSQSYGNDQGYGNSQSYGGGQQQGGFSSNQGYNQGGNNQNQGSYNTPNISIEDDDIPF